MRVILQRSKQSSVSFNGKTNKIDFGLVVLVGFTEGDSIEDIDYMVRKIINMRIFDDENHIMNKSILDVSGSILSISQFTLYADCHKGNRPSYKKALNGSDAYILYDLFNKKLKEYGYTEEGFFGEDMLVSIQNDGPVTITLESR